MVVRRAVLVVEGGLEGKYRDIDGGPGGIVAPRYRQILFGRCNYFCPSASLLQSTAGGAPLALISW